MSKEFRPQGAEGVRQNFRNLWFWKRHDLPSGDTMFTSDRKGEPYVPLIIGKGYQHLISDILSIIDPLYPGLAKGEYDELAPTMLRSHDYESDVSLVTQDFLGDEQLPVAIKIFNPSSNLGYMTGTHMFTAFRTLEEHGVTCVDIVAAAENILIIKWTDEPTVDISNESWDRYDPLLAAVANKLYRLSQQAREKGEIIEDWTDDWEVDTFPQNYRRNSNGKENTLTEILAVDPVFPLRKAKPVRNS